MYYYKWYIIEKKERYFIKTSDKANKYFSQISPTLRNFNGVIFSDILKETYPELALMELKREKMLLTNSPVQKFSKKDLDAYNNYVKQIEEAYEVLTGTKITPRNTTAMAIREVPVSLAKEYYDNLSYHTRLSNFYTNYIVTQESTFANIRDLSGFIEGEIDGIAVSGKFKGTLSKRKK